MTSTGASAFNGDDREPPRISQFEVALSPSQKNDWRISILLKTTDDRNLVSPPKIILKLAFPWKTSVAPPAPRCLNGAFLELNLSTFEQVQMRMIDATKVQQTFLFLGRIPSIPILEKSCPEFRDLARPPVVALNGRGIITTYSKGSSLPNYQGSIFEPKIEDASGRIYDPKNVTNVINPAQLIPSVWPNDQKELCLSEVSTKSILEQQAVFKSLDQELAKAVEIGNFIEFAEVSELQKTLEYAIQLQKIIDGEAGLLSSFPICSKMIDGRRLSSQLNAVIGKIKKSNDDYSKNLVNQLKKTERENASKLAEEREARLFALEEMLKEINNEYLQLSENYSDLTRMSSVQNSKTSFGSKEKAKISNKALEDRKKVREQISIKNQELLNWHSEKIGIERESDGLMDNLSKSFYQQALLKYDQIRLAKFKILLLLLRFDQFYTRLAS